LANPVKQINSKRQDFVTSLPERVFAQSVPKIKIFIFSQQKNERDMKISRIKKEGDSELSPSFFTRFTGFLGL